MELLIQLTIEVFPIGSKSHRRAQRTEYVVVLGARSLLLRFVGKSVCAKIDLIIMYLYYRVRLTVFC